MGLGRLELPTSRLSDMSRALVGARERWKQGDLADSALVSAGQRWWAMIQVVLQVHITPSEQGFASSCPRLTQPYPPTMIPPCDDHHPKGCCPASCSSSSEHWLPAFRLIVTGWREMMSSSLSRPTTTGTESS